MYNNKTSAYKDKNEDLFDKDSNENSKWNNDKLEQNENNLGENNQNTWITIKPRLVRENETSFDKSMNDARHNEQKQWNKERTI